MNLPKIWFSLLVLFLPRFLFSWSASLGVVGNFLQRQTVGGRRLEAESFSVYCCLFLPPISFCVLISVVPLSFFWMILDFSWAGPTPTLVLGLGTAWILCFGLVSHGPYQPHDPTHSRLQIGTNGPVVLNFSPYLSLSGKLGHSSPHLIGLPRP